MTSIDKSQDEFQPQGQPQIITAGEATSQSVEAAKSVALGTSTIQKSALDADVQISASEAVPPIAPPFPYDNLLSMLNNVTPDLTVAASKGPAIANMLSTSPTDNVSHALLHFEQQLQSIATNMLNAWIDNLKNIEIQRKLDQKVADAKQTDAKQGDKGQMQKVMMMAAISAFFACGLGCLGQLAAKTPVVAVQVSALQGIHHVVMALTPSHLSLGLGLAASSFTAGAIWSTLISRNDKSETYNTQKYALQILNVVKEPSFNHFLFEMVASKGELGSSISEDEKNRICSTIKSVLLMTAIAVHYKGTYGHLTAEEIGELIKRGQIT